MRCTGLRALADELGVWLLIGSALVRRDGRQGGQPLDPGRPDGRVVGDLRQAAHVRRRPAHRRAHPRVGSLRRPATGRWSPSAAGAQARPDHLLRPALPGAATAPWPRPAPRCSTVPAGLHPARPARRTGRCCCAPGRSRPAPSCWRRRRAGRHEDGRATWGRSMVVGALGRGPGAGRPRRARRADGRPRPGRGGQGARGDPGAGQRAGVRRRAMIRYALVCDHGHEFEGWFGASADFDDQAGARPARLPGLRLAARCASRSWPRPSPARRSAASRPTPTPAQARDDDGGHGPGARPRRGELRLCRRPLRHARPAPSTRASREDRGIYGEATPAEVKALVEDGVPVAPLPPEPPKKTEVN